jgi:hypothetical protein
VRLSRARSWGGGAPSGWSELRLNLNDLDEQLDGRSDPLALPRMLMEDTWQESADKLRKLAANLDGEPYGLH